MSSKNEDQIFRKRQSIEGKKGGIATLKKHGSKHFSKIAKDRWKAVAKKQHAKVS